jgi:hypothetical protein
MAKLDYYELMAMLNNPDIPDEKLRQYLTVDPKSGPFDPVVVPNEDTVEITELEAEAADAMRIGNGLARWRRQRRFQKRKARGEALPVLVSEGDSWFQFPFLITDVVDHLGDEYLIWSVGAAGDTAQNMVHRNPEYIRALKTQNGRLDGFLFSAAGNDVIGEDEDKKPVLEKILKPFNKTQDARGHINQNMLNKILGFLAASYQKVVDTVRAEPEFARLPIVFHGYDYPFAYPHGDAQTDPRSPVYAARDEWLGSAFDARGIMDEQLRRDILVVLIDALYDMLNAVAGDSKKTHIYVVDVRGTLSEVNDWNDEIHGTDAGFARVADKFRAALRGAITNGAGV